MSGLSYETRKALNEAGWPPYGWTPESESLPADASAASVPETLLASPTLEELIEACGERFGAVYRPVNCKPSVWRGESFGALRRVESEPCASPAEAVAGLWLALRKEKP